MLGRYFSILATASAVGITAFAADVCTTLPKCLDLRDQVEAQIQKFLAGTIPVFGEIVKKDSSIEKICFHVGYANSCLMTYENALNYCSNLEPKGSQHLPSARELALLSASLGAKGILEVDEYKAKKAAGENVSDYYLVDTQKADGSLDDQFYFNPSGYKRPAGELGQEGIWSVSISPRYPEGVFTLNAENGAVGYYWFRRDVMTAVRCVRSR